MASEKKQERIAYSYIRFSSSQQEKGDSLRRQVELRDKVLAEHPEWKLSDTPYLDLGKSGFDGSHIADGALGAFIVASESGKIPRGSVLIIEQWDRLSRLPAVEAIELFSRITRCGVDICTAIDGEVHNRESMKDTGNLLKSIIRMQVAHEESEKKSDRIKKVWEEKRRNTATVVTSVCPGWLRRNGVGFELIPERAAIVVEIFQKTAAGMGRLSICNDLNTRKEPCWGPANIGGWWPCTVSKILRSRSAIGEFQPYRTFKVDIDGRIRIRREPAGEVRQDYFPRVIDDITWQKVQQRVAAGKKCKGAMPGAGRPSRPGTMPVRNLFTGYIFDGYHPKYPMLTEGNTAYLASDWTRINPGAHAVKWNLADLERSILSYLRELDLGALAAEQPVATEEEARLAKVTTKLDGIAVRLEQLLDSLEKVTEKQQKDIILKRIAERAKEKGSIEEEASGLKAAVEKKKAATIALADARKDLCKFLEAKDLPTRLRLRAELRRIVARIDVFPDGPPDVRNDPRAEPSIQLTFHNGARRIILPTLSCEVTLDKDGNDI